MIEVVNIRDMKDASTFLYVGRANPRRRLKAHPLANPFKLSPQADAAEREQCMRDYRAWLLARPEAEAEIRALGEEATRNGLPLGCWCKPEPCHADLLAELAEQVMAEKPLPRE